MPDGKTQDSQRLDRVVAEARQQREQREKGYRAQALKLYPWVCGRCTREFERHNLHELTVHHRDHNHDNNPPDGSNWELLCLYCHDNEHARLTEAQVGTSMETRQHGIATHNPFSALKQLMQRDED